MNSMTGFGKAEHKTKAGKLTVEISSVNNRYLEISPRLPKQFFSLEPKVRELVSSKISRGKINLFVGFEELNDNSGRYPINIKAAKAYYKQLIKLKRELKIKSEIDIKDLVLLPDVTRPENSDFDEGSIWYGLKRSVNKALVELINMRRKEGAAMAKDMKERLITLEKQIKKIEKNTSKAVNRYRDKLNKRINELLNSPVPDRIRLEEEIAIMAERTDISEECTRFISHLKQYNSTLKVQNPVGKKLNFILQEMNREANTIASKCTDISISSNVISIKEQIEKLRELVQNVE